MFCLRHLPQQARMQRALFELLQLVCLLIPATVHAEQNRSHILAQGYDLR